MKRFLILTLILSALTGCSAVESEKNKNLALNHKENSEVKIKKVDFDLLEIYEHTVPENMKFLPKYDRHPEALNYVFFKTETGNIREFPTVESKVIKTGKFNEKFKALGKVVYQGNTWYKVELTDGREGYISKQIVEFRNFKFHDALKGIESALDFVKNGNQSGEKLAVVDSYRPDPNSLGQKRDRDKYGTTEDQSLVGMNSLGERVFIPDRSIVKILKQEKDGVRIQASSIPEEYLIVDRGKIVSKRDLSANTIKKAVVIDTANQNKMIFENIDGEWSVISYVYSKTGFESQLGYETPKGHFIAAVSKNRMYYNDALGNEQGYAKYATRFSGGGYVHSTPLDKSEQENREYFLSQKEANLGTYPGTRKCVRTTESHAKFIREWVLGDSFNPNLDEQFIKDNVLFVVL